LLIIKLLSHISSTCILCLLAPLEGFYHSHDIVGEGCITLQRSSKIGKVCGMQHWGWLFSDGHTT